MRAGIVRGFIREFGAIGYQKFVGRSTIIGKGTDNGSVVVSEIGGAVGLYDRPVCQIREDELRRIRYSVLPLCTRAAAKRRISPAHYCVSTNVVVRLDHDQRRPLADCRNGGGGHPRPRPPN